jgi:hypothetical protein
MPFVVNSIDAEVWGFYIGSLFILLIRWDAFNRPSPSPIFEEENLFP